MIRAISGTVPGSALLGVTGGSIAPANILPITVNGALCSANSYLNKPCVSITVCSPGSTTNCQTINDILLDTGSFGLRIFNQVITVLPAPSGSGVLAECVQFGDGSTLWGPVQTAGVILGTEPAVSVPIQVIDSTLPGAPTICANAEQTPSAAGFNGILGLGVFSHDCGSACANSAIPMYYSCSGSACTATAVTLVNQVQNPVVSLPTDSNGVIVELQSVPLSGASSADGLLVLGIGTQTNNAPPAGVKVYNTGSSTSLQPGEITTILNGVSYSSIIDSGSNGLFFPSPSSSILPNCPSTNAGWFCPSSTTILSATNEGASGSPSIGVFFQIGNLTSLTSSGINNAFSNIGGSAPGMFDWGLPFYLGRNIYVGIEGKSAPSLGPGVTGPFFAY